MEALFQPLAGFKNSQSKKITNIFFYHFHVLMMWVKDDYHHVMGLKSEYVSIKARNGASSPNMSCHASYINSCHGTFLFAICKYCGRFLSLF
jgi:hypothetical protein